MIIIIVIIAFIIILIIITFVVTGVHVFLLLPRHQPTPSRDATKGEKDEERKKKIVK
jgi:uncharacterized protein YpmS